MSSKEDNPDDRELFLREMQGVKPLNTPPRAPRERAKPNPVPIQREADEKRVLDELLLEPEPLEGLDMGEELLYLRPGYQKRFLNRLRRGHWSIQDHLDLHHMTESIARETLLAFLAHAQARGLSCVRVVHGKGLRSQGLPKLKTLTNGLLRRHPAVIAFASCRQVDGGTGAVTVLLKSA